MSTPPTSPWRAARLRGHGRERLLFGAMYEDATLDGEVLAASTRVFAIASAGDTAIGLADAGRRVTAVDVNPAQVAYARHRLAGGPYRPGSADRLLRAVRLAARAVGWTPRTLRRFLLLDDPPRQARVFDRLLDTPRFRLAVAALFSPATLLRGYRPEFVAFLPHGFGAELRQRLQRGFARHPNHTNPYARLLLLGEAPPVAAGRNVDLHVAEAAAFLEQQPPGTFDGFTLSNVLDGPDRAFRDRLAAAVGHAGTPDAPVVLRTLRCPTDAAASGYAARDRAMIWGGIIVTTAAAFPAAVRGLT